MTQYSRDFEGLSRFLNARSLDLLQSWLPGGKRKGNEYVCADLTGGEGGSTSINLKTGKWADFNSGPEGHDLISLYANINGIKNGEAYDILAKEYGFEGGGIGPPPPRPAPAPTSLGKPPIGTPAPSFDHYKYGPASGHWTYLDFDGSVLFYISRHDPPSGKKQFIPWTWDTKKNQWENKHFPSPRPLYGLELLAKHPDLPVMVVEGEKACDAARILTAPSYVVVTWPGGSKAIEQVDWSPLAGRNILLWPDGDEAGKSAMQKIAERLSKND